MDLKFSPLIFLSLSISIGGCSQAPEGSTTKMNSGNSKVAINSLEFAKQFNVETAAESNGMGRIQSGLAKLKNGDMAPMFDLPALDGKSRTSLSLLIGKKPIVLIFGSYT